MMMDWNGYRQQLVETIGKIARLSPETVKGYNTLSAARVARVSQVAP